MEGEPNEEVITENPESVKFGEEVHIEEDMKTYEDQPDHEKYDYILVTNIGHKTERDIAIDPDIEQKDEEKEKDKLKKRDIFLRNLRDEDLEITTSTYFIPEKDQILTFDKVRAPMKVLEKYGEILKFKLPLKHAEQLKQELHNVCYVPLPHNNNQANVETKSIYEKIKSIYKTISSSKLGRKVKEIFYIGEEIDSLKNDDESVTATWSRDKRNLFNEDDPLFFSHSKRTRIVEYILDRTEFSDDTKVVQNEDEKLSVGITKLLYEGVYTDQYSLHEGDIDLTAEDSPVRFRRDLFTQWGSFTSFYKFQPLDAIR